MTDAAIDIFPDLEARADIAQNAIALAHVLGILAGIGHRVVHRGLDYADAVRVDGRVLTALERLTPLAPLHQPRNLAPIRVPVGSKPLQSIGRTRPSIHSTRVTTAPGASEVGL